MDRFWFWKTILLQKQLLTEELARICTVNFFSKRLPSLKSKVLHYYNYVHKPQWIPTIYSGIQISCWGATRHESTSSITHYLFWLKTQLTMKTLMKTLPTLNHSNWMKFISWLRKLAWITLTHKCFEQTWVTSDNATTTISYDRSIKEPYIQGSFITNCKEVQQSSTNKKLKIGKMTEADRK